MASVIHVLGARPNFVKAAPVITALSAQGVPQALIHTGQHYDPLMSSVFFGDLELPEPLVNLAVGSGSHGRQTGALLAALEDVLLQARPQLVLVYGDVNSALAAALACVKVGIPIGHVEAGLRSFDRSMPEEINRILVDAMADLLFVTSPEAIGHLGREGIDPARTYLVGNPMIDSLLLARDRLGVPERYAVATLHRPGNVDDPDAAASVIGALREVGTRIPVVVPVHPRSRAAFAGAAGGLRLADPLSYLDFLALVASAALVITDSGGVQEETTVLGIPCLTVRPSTERPITISHGTNQLVTAATLPASADKVLADGARPVAGELPPLWDGHAGERIARTVAGWLRHADRATPTAAST